MTPQLRFSEFTDEWQSSKLGDFATFSKGTGISKNDITDNGRIKAIRYGELYTKYNERISEVHSSTNLPEKGLVYSKQNDVIIPASGETHIDIATASCVIDEGVALSGDINIIRSNNDGVFIAYYLNNKKKVDIARLAQGVSVVHLYSNNLKSLALNLPPYSEQRKIAEFLAIVDERLDRSIQKVMLLQRYKNSLAEKLFKSKTRFEEGGVAYPDWVEISVGDALTIRNDLRAKSSDYPLMAFVANIGVVAKGDRYNREFLVNKINDKHYKRTEYGDFIYSSNNLESGSIGLNFYGPATISPVYSIFQIGNPYNTRFIGSLLRRKQFIHTMTRYRQGVVYGQWKIHEEDFLKIKIKVPSIEEQNRIASSLASLEDRIKAEQARLIAAGRWRAAILKKIFV